jgi:hypothetical protein
MIRNGLYFYSSKALDGVAGGADGVMVLRDGKMLGGTSFFYFIGTYSSSGGKWKGELTDQEHTPAPAALPMERDWSPSASMEHIPTKALNFMPLHSLASRVSNIMRLCGCWQRTDEQAAV